MTKEEALIQILQETQMCLHEALTMPPVMLKVAVAAVIVDNDQELSNLGIRVAEPTERI